MKFDLSNKNKVDIYIINYMNEMVDNFPIKLDPNDTSPDPATGNLFGLVNIKELTEGKSQEFHTFFSKGLFP